MFAFYKDEKRLATFSVCLTLIQIFIIPLENVKQQSSGESALLQTLYRLKDTHIHDVATASRLNLIYKWSKGIKK